MTKKRISIVLIILAAFCAVAALQAVFGSICIFKAVTGIPCAGCGMTRAALAVLRLDFRLALQMNPLIFFLPMLLIVPHLNKKQLSYAAVISAVAVFLIYGSRMLLLFPNTAPMDFNENALIPSVLSSIKIIFGF